MTTTATAAQQLEAGRKKLEALRDRRSKAQARIEEARRVLAEAQAEAQKEFGTSDLTELREMYTRQSSENDRKVLDFVGAIQFAEEQLQDVERQLAT